MEVSGIEIIFTYSFLQVFSNDITYHCVGYFVCCFMLKTMGQIFQRTENLVLCDNQAVSQCLCSGKSRSIFLQNALREICFLAAVNEFQLKGHFIEGSSYRTSDILSRRHLHSYSKERFLELTGDYTLCEYSVESEMFSFINDW